MPLNNPNVFETGKHRRISFYHFLISLYVISISRSFVKLIHVEDPFNVREKSENSKFNMNSVISPIPNSVH